MTHSKDWLKNLVAIYPMCRSILTAILDKALGPVAKVEDPRASKPCVSSHVSRIVNKIESWNSQRLTFMDLWM